MSMDPTVLIFGLGVSDPKRFFGTTNNLIEKYSKNRVFECPTSENSYLGHSLGLALSGYKPVVHFQRMDFMLYAFDQLVNNVAKWNSMFGTNQNISLTIRSIVGHGWGQGAQHSQNLAPILAQIPGLQIATPSCPKSAYHILRNAIQSNLPTVFIEHRWLQYLKSDFNFSKVNRTKAKNTTAIKRKTGQQATIISWSYATVECLRFCEIFPEASFDIFDLMSLTDINFEQIIDSLKKTGRLIVWEPSYEKAGIGAEYINSLMTHLKNIDFLRIGNRFSYPAATPIKYEKTYNSLPALCQKLNSYLNSNFSIERANQSRWPVDEDFSDWSPWLNPEVKSYEV